MMGMPVRDGGDGPYCTTTAECTGDSSNLHLCRGDHACAPLLSDDCPIVYGNSQDRLAIGFGAYTHIDPNDIDQSPTRGSTPVRDYELAVQELNNAGGLPDRTGARHPLFVVVCNRDPGDSAHIPRTVDHLVSDLGLTAIVADLAPDDLAQAFQRVRDKHIFWISPGPQTQELADLDPAGLLWNLLGSPREVAPIYPALLTRLIARIQPSPGSKLRIAVVRSTDPSEPTRALLDDLFNDVGPRIHTQELMAIADILSYDIDAAHTVQDVVNQLVADSPHIVISMAGTQFTNNTTNAEINGVVAALERLIGATPVDHPRPYYIFNPVNFAERDGLSRILFNSVQSSAPYQRFLGVNVARTDDRTLYNDYLNALKDFFPAAEGETESWYDAVYYLAYSMYVAGLEQPLDGARIRSGMLSLLAGTAYSVGPGNIPNVLAALGNSSSSIQLVGTVGPPIFYTDTGARAGKGALFCFDEVDSVHPQVQVYDATTGTWSGTFDCYPGFP
jgi:hypothetical protein